MRRLLLPFVLLMGMVAVAQVAAPPVVTVDEILANADKYDQQGTVAVKGIVVDFEQKTSRSGNSYFIFKLKAGKGELNVFSAGKATADVKNKAEAIVTGVFRKSKNVADFTVKNEVDASPAKDKPFGVKIVTPAK